VRGSRSTLSDRLGQVASADDDQAHDTEPLTPDDARATHAGPDRAQGNRVLDTARMTVPRDGSPRRIPPSTIRPTGDHDDQADALEWTRAFLAEHGDTLADVLLDELLAAARDASIDEAGVRRALATQGVRTRADGTLRQRPRAADVMSSAADADPESVTWVRALLDARAADGAILSRQDLLRAADEAGIDASEIRRALAALGVPLRRNRVGWPARATRQGDPRASLEPAKSRPEQQSTRAPAGKVHVVGVDLDEDGQPVDTLQPMPITVRISCDEAGTLAVRVLVRGAGHGELEAVPPVREVTEPGELALQFEVPPDALGELKHAVDVEVWLRTSTETYASMHVAARRFRSRERGGSRPFVRVDASWSKDAP